MMCTHDLTVRLWHSGGCCVLPSQVHAVGQECVGKCVGKAYYIPPNTHMPSLCTPWQSPSKHLEYSPQSGTTLLPHRYSR
jgi:hypothetical protein